MAEKLSKEVRVSDDILNDESTIAPSDAGGASQFTESTTWSYVEPDEYDHVSDAASTTQPSIGHLTEGPDGKPVRTFRNSAELRAARLQQMGLTPAADYKSKPKAVGCLKGSVKAPSKSTQASTSGGQASIARPATTSTAVRPRSAGTQGFNIRSEEERMRAKEALQGKLTAQAKAAPASGRPVEFGAHRTLGSPGAVHSLPSGHISFHSTTTGFAPAKRTKAERNQINKALEVKSALDKMSREQIRDAGLWEYNPAKNPVVNESPDGTGYHWHVGFKEFQHTLGGVADPCSQPKSKAEIQQMHKAEELKLALDIHSREKLRDDGIWEHNPAKNPIVNESPDGTGYHWHVGFAEFQHTLGGVPDSKPVARPHHADNLNRQLDVMSREQLRDAGVWERAPARNPVVTESASKGGGMNWSVSF